MDLQVLEVVGGMEAETGILSVVAGVVYKVRTMRLDFLELGGEYMVQEELRRHHEAAVLAYSM